MKREYLLEILAELEHEQWAAWSQDISQKEKLSDGCIKRWQSFWVPYSELNEDIKDSDRKYANIILNRLEKEKMVEFEK